MANITLRAFNFKDTPEYLRLSHSCPDIKGYLPCAVARSFNSTADLVTDFARADFEKQFAFIIEVSNDLGDKCAVGALFASMEQYTPTSLNVSYFIGESYRNMGFAKEALKKFVSYVRHETHYDSLIFDVQKDNKISKTIVKSLGANSIGESPISIFARYERFVLSL